jgi:hypothetical protein
VSSMLTTVPSAHPHPTSHHRRAEPSKPVLGHVSDAAEPTRERPGRARVTVRRTAIITLAVVLAITGSACTGKKKKKGRKKIKAGIESTQTTPEPTDPAIAPTPGLPGAAVPAAGRMTIVGRSYVVRPGVNSKAIVGLDSYRTMRRGTSPAFPPRSGGFAVFTMRLQTIAGNVYYNPLYFKLLTPDGRTVKAFDGNAPYLNVQPKIRAGAVPPGRVLRFKVTMDSLIRPGTRLVYVSPLGKVVATWAL